MRAGYDSIKKLRTGVMQGRGGAYKIADDFGLTPPDNTS